MNRLNLVWQHGTAMGLDVDLNAVSKAKALLGKNRHRPQNITALHWTDVPAFYESLSEGIITHLALSILILTGVRTVPAEFMKGRLDKATDFRVTLSSEALKVLDMAKPFAVAGNLFSGVCQVVISDATVQPPIYAPIFDRVSGTGGFMFRAWLGRM